MNLRRFGIILAIVAILLLVPAIAMLVSDGANWSPADFVIAAILLTGLLTGLDTLNRKVKRKSLRIGLILLLLFLFVLLWAEMAVGLFGSPISGS